MTKMNLNYRRLLHHALVPMVTLATLLTLLALNAHAADEKAAKTSAKVAAKSATKAPRQIAAENLGEYGQILASYLGCARPLRQESDIEALRSCVVPHLAAGADRSRQDRLVSWLILNPQIEEIRRCEAHDLQAAEYFSEKTFHHLCFQFKLNGQTRVAVAFFKAKTAKNRAGLYSFFY